MLDKLSSFYNKLLIHLTFRQRFMVFACIFILCLPFPIYWLIIGQNLYIESARSQIENFRNQKIWNSLLNDILQYHLNYETANEEQLADYNQKILFRLSSIQNRQTTVEKPEIKSHQADFLIKLWQRIINKKPPSSYIHFAQEERVIEIILEELKLRTLGDEKIEVNLFPNNQIINFVLCELYHIQIFSIKSLTWESLIKQEPQNQEKYERLFNMSLFRLNEAIAAIKRYSDRNIKFNSIINDPAFLLYMKDKTTFSTYLKNLTAWVGSIRQRGTKESQQIAYALLQNYNHITDSLIDYGISSNERNKNWHELIKYLCIGLIITALGTVLFYVIFHVLTNHFLALNEHIKAISQGKFKQCFCSNADDSFGPVGQAFDKLSQSIQQVVSELQRLGRQLAESIKQISLSTKDQNKAFLSDEKKIKELEDHTRTIASHTEILAKNMNELISSSQQNILSEKAKNTLEKMQGMISSLRDRSNHIIHHLSSLKTKLEGNKNLFAFLTKVSNQAALLSLNSAIEASNIISNKQGFIKISFEIKRFADKTSASTEDIEKTIKGIFLSIQKIYQDTNIFLNELNDSAAMMKVVEKHLNDMTEQMDDQRAKFLTVNRAMQDQAHITDEIKNSLDHLAEVARENSGHTHQLSHTMVELSMTAEKLQFVLNQFFHPKRFKNDDEK